MVPDMRTLEFIPPWDRVPVTLWPNIRWAVRENAYAPPLPAEVIGCGGAGARVAASLRGPGVKVVAIQDPRMSLRKFDLVLAARHDGITGENVIVTRTALHRVTQARLAAQREAWAPVFAPHKRPMLAVLLGCGLRRSEVAALTLKHIQQRDNRWCIVDLVGKHRRVRTPPVPTWVRWPSTRGRQRRS